MCWKGRETKQTWAASSVRGKCPLWHHIGKAKDGVCLWRFPVIQIIIILKVAGWTQLVWFSVPWRPWRQPSIPKDGLLSFQGNLLTKAAQIRSQQSNDGWEPGALVSSFHHRAARPIVSACPADWMRDWEDHLLNNGSEPNSTRPIRAAKFSRGTKNVALFVTVRQRLVGGGGRNWLWNCPLTCETFWHRPESDDLQGGKQGYTDIRSASTVREDHRLPRPPHRVVIFMKW